MQKSVIIYKIVRLQEKNMIKNNKLLIIAIALLALTIFFIPTYSYATNPGSPIDNPDGYKPGPIDSGDTIQIGVKANTILSIISIIGIIISVISLIILGIKYMVGSIEEKAEYKKSMIPYIVGILFLVSTSAIVKFIANLTQATL